MRHLFVGLCVLCAAAGCVGPHSTGALWAQQNLDQEMAFYAVSDAQRAEAMHTYVLGLVDEGLAAERQRIEAGLQECPGPLQTFAISQGDTVRDAIRLHARGDATRLAELARIATADWYVRRAASTGDAGFCQRAEAALAGGLPVPQSDVLGRLPAATVTRDPHQPAAVVSGDPPLVTLSNYAMGATDAVTADAPLPQYLALVYGGFLFSSPGTPPAMDTETAAAMVDDQATAYPDWEPDALYAALRGGQW
jgi:hypothetical protein